MIQAICFDAFGTLVEITDKRRPFHALLRGGVTSITAEEVLTKPLNLREVAAGSATSSGRAAWRNSKRTCRLNAPPSASGPGSPKSGSSLRERGLRIGVCSNLALPYGAPLLAALPDTPDAVILSYEVGLVKPDPAIFHLVCDRLGLQPAEILFVGDTPSADIEGPHAIGMSAMHISDFEVYTGAKFIGSENSPRTSSRQSKQRNTASALRIHRAAMPERSTSSKDQALGP